MDSPGLANRSPGLHAILYAAKSTQDRHASIPTQLDDCRAMADREGWLVVGDFHDEGFSAYSRDRGPGLVAAKAKAKELAQIHGSAMLIVQHSDRLARGSGMGREAATHLVEVVFELSRAGVQIASTQDDATFSSLLLAAVMGDRNFEDSRRKSAAVRAGMDRRAAQGKPGGGPPPLGYRWERTSGAWEVDPQQAQTVRRIFAEYAAGHSQLEITRNLRRDAVPTKSGGEWHQGTVRGILANPAYVGRLRHRGGEVAGRHSAIVDEDVWSRVSERSRANARTSGGGRGRPPRESFLLLKGMLRCGECGSAMVPRTQQNRRGGTYAVYRCYGRHRDPESCPMPPAPRRIVDESLLAYFEWVGVDVDDMKRDLANVADAYLKECRELLVGAEHEAATLVASRDRLRRLLVEGRLEPEEWRPVDRDLLEGLEAARSQQDQLASRLQELERGVSATELNGQVAQRLLRVREAVAQGVSESDTIEAVRVELQRLFDCFVLHRHSLDDDFLEEHSEDFENALPDIHLTPDGRSYYLAPRPREELVHAWMCGPLADGHITLYPLFGDVLLARPDKYVEGFVT